MERINSVIRDKEKAPRSAVSPRGLEEAGDDVLSHRVASAVPSAQRGLTAVFGMGTGVTPTL